MKKEIIEKAKMLAGISLSDWKMLSFVVNESFNKKEKELERDLKLSTSEIEKFIHERFE
ncbi:MAG: hypothetical protein ACI4RN_02710 [Oscillospiraceae bacterium]